jgi:hypothetical protein
MSSATNPAPIAAVETSATEGQKLPPSSPTPSLSNEDKLVLNLAKTKRQLAQQTLETAQAKAESSEIAFRYTILQIYRKYGLSDADQINDETGQIIFGKEENVSR